MKTAVAHARVVHESHGIEKRNIVANMNLVIVAGNLTRDVELRHTAGGDPVAGFGLAINRKWRNKAGEQKEEVTFVEITVWGRMAENAAEYLQKGSSCLVQGHLKLDQWEDRQSGAKRSKLKVVADRVQFLGSWGKKADEGRQGNVNNLDGEGHPPRGNRRQEDQAPPDKDVPF